MVDLSQLTQLLLPHTHLSLVPSASFSPSLSLQSGSLPLTFSCSFSVSHLLSLISFLSLTKLVVPPLWIFPFMGLYEWNERRKGSVCPCVCQAKLFLPDVSLCFILPSATLSACHRQIRSSGAWICVCLRGGE